MADVQNTPYLSIGEVLGLLLEEFPDITISKIRFLESQGLISPERTSSGYRKFYDDDVELLRVILTEQRQNYLPLRVIKDRLASGEIDPTGEHLRPDDDPASAATPADDDLVEPADVPPERVAGHPAARSADLTGGIPRPADPPSTPADADGGDAPSDDIPNPGPPADETDPGDDAVGATPQLLTGVLLDRGEFCAMVGMSEGELEQLEAFGIVSPREGSGVDLYGDEAVEIARPACEFLRLGIDARHLRNWRTSAEREVSLYEQIITPRLRHRNPEARAEALDQLRALDELGAVLRGAMTRSALRHHFES